MLRSLTLAEIQFATESMYGLLPKKIGHDHAPVRHLSRDGAYGKKVPALAIHRQELRFFPASGEFWTCSDEELGELACIFEREAGTDMGILNEGARLSYTEYENLIEWYVRFPAYPRVLFCVRTIPCEDEKTGINIRVLHETAVITRGLFKKEGRC
jgi:hypothetical protein